MTFNPAIRMSRPAGYGMAIGLSGAAFLTTRWLTPALPNAPFDLFQGAVVVCAVYGGIGPALVATTLSIAALDYFFLPPFNKFSLAAADVLQLATFGAVAVLTSSLSARLKKAMSDLAVETEQRLAAEAEVIDNSSREERRLGQDLHDGLCQILAGIRLLSEDLKRKLQAQAPTLTPDIARIETSVVQAMAQAEDVARDLYPVALETNGLSAALEEMTGYFSGLSSASCRYLSKIPVQVSNVSMATDLYRLAREAVANAVKSGKAKRVRVRLSSKGKRLMLSVMDDGRGFAPAAISPGKSMGIQLMKYRAQRIGAKIGWRSRPGGCTLVRCVLSEAVL